MDTSPTLSPRHLDWILCLIRFKSSRFDPCRAAIRRAVRARLAHGLRPAWGEYRGAAIGVARGEGARPEALSQSKRPEALSLWKRS